jgi:structural maintenance of chromosome 4
MVFMQEVKAAAAEALKEMAAYEKQEVGLEEKRKHANSKAKKFKKSLQDVKRLEISRTKRRLTNWITLGRESSQ